MEAESSNPEFPPELVELGKAYLDGSSRGTRGAEQQVLPGLEAIFAENLEEDHRKAYDEAVVENAAGPLSVAFKIMAAEAIELDRVHLESMDISRETPPADATANELRDWKARHQLRLQLARQRSRDQRKHFEAKSKLANNFIKIAKVAGAFKVSSLPGTINVFTLSAALSEQMAGYEAGRSPDILDILDEGKDLLDLVDDTDGEK